MIDKNFIKKSTNERLEKIDNFVDTFLKNDYINTLIKNYSSELEGYNYINSLEIFSTLPLKGSIRYINKYTKEIRFGGLLIKIYKQNNNWYAILKKFDGKKYHISFKSNYIFYRENKDELFRNALEYFVSDVDSGNFFIGN